MCWSRPGQTRRRHHRDGLVGSAFNGYSLVRKVLLEIDRMNLAGHVEEFGRTWAKSY